MRPASVAAAVLMFGALSVPAYADDPTGLWLTDDGAAKIKIAKCGPNMCGTVAWLKEPNDDAGKPKTDAYNTDASKRGRPIIGVPIVLPMKPDGANKWSGEIYNAEDGKTYSGNITVAGNILKVQGCVALFCKTRTWTRTN